MARTRTTQAPEAKRGEILDAASLLFGRDGFEGTSMAKLAAAAGVTPNTLYWYFDDKDAILIAVLEQTFRQAAQRAAADRPVELVDRLLWLVGVFDGISGLTATLHARARVSASVRAWHEDFHRTGDAWLLRAAKRHLAASSGEQRATDDELASIPRLWSYAIEGMVVHELAPDERRRLCESLVRQLEAVGQPDGPAHAS